MLSPNPAEGHACSLAQRPYSTRSVLAAPRGFTWQPSSALVALTEVIDSLSIVGALGGANPNRSPTPAVALAAYTTPVASFTPTPAPPPPGTTKRSTRLPLESNLDTPSPSSTYTSPLESSTLIPDGDVRSTTPFNNTPPPSNSATKSPPDPKFVCTYRSPTASTPRPRSMNPVPSVGTRLVNCVPVN